MSNEDLRNKARWSPHKRQEDALARPEFEIGFGGARGGGKTDAGLAWIRYDSDNPRLRGLVVRKNSIDLGDWIARARSMYAGEATITGNPPVLTFNKGATYVLGHIKDEKAYSKYQGQEFPRMLFEELEQIPSEESYEMILASCRSTIPGVKPQVFSTFNPGGPGHTWIKKRFRLEGIPTKPIITKDPKTGRMRVFVPSRVDDNPTLMEQDPDYVHFLEGLGDGLREQWRWGSWDNPVIKGAYYTLEMEQARREGRIADFPHFKGVGVHTWWDIGNDMTSIGFFQFVDGWWYLIDYYQNDSRGLPHYINKLQEFRESKGYRYAVHHFPHDIENREWGSERTRIEVIEAANMDYEIVPKIGIEDGREAARIIFNRVRFDQRNCAPLIDALTNYAQEWIPDRQVFSGKHIHNWASHPADMFRYFSVTNHYDITGVLKRPKKSELPRLARDLAQANGEDYEEYEGSPEFGTGRNPQGQGGRFHYE